LHRLHGNDAGTVQNHLYPQKILIERLAQCQLLEVISKPHLSSDSCVAALFKMLTYSPCMLRFFIGLRLALERDLTF
jgi:hypothetical protein